MTKSARAKKNKKADFAKVKLKVGKKIKKAQNETRTDFKARKIILKEQLEKKSDQTLLTKKKHNIKELLSRLSHSSSYVRQDGVTGLLEIVKKNQKADLEPFLPTMIQGVAPSIFDTDTLIRTSAIKFMDALILKVGNSIEPYFNIVATHLSCAMVHLNINVQGDSLKLMRVLTRHTPQLIARHADTLLKNFVSLISRKASSAQMITRSKPNKVDFSRLLHVNPNNNLTAHKWRLQLLQELSSFLEAILGEQRRVQAQVPYTLWQTIVDGSLPPVVCGDSVQGKTQESGVFSDPWQLEKFCFSIIPLLFQIWAEVDIQEMAGSATPLMAMKVTRFSDAEMESMERMLSTKAIKNISDSWEEITQQNMNNNLRKLISSFEMAMDMALEMDPNVDRSCTFIHNVKKDIRAYYEVLEKRKNAQQMTRCIYHGQTFNLQCTNHPTYIQQKTAFSLQQVNHSLQPLENNSFQCKLTPIMSEVADDLCSDDESEMADDPGSEESEVADDPGSGNTLSGEGVQTLSCIVSIITHLWHITQLCTNQQPSQCTWFMVQLKSKYMSKIMCGFPYYCHMSTSQKKLSRSGVKKLTTEGDYSLRHCDDVNVSLALLTMQLSSSEVFQEEAVNFLSKLLRDGNQDRQYNLGSVVTILLDLLQVIPKSQGEILVNAAQTCYSNFHPLKKDRALLLQILLAATDVDHTYLWDCRNISVWVDQLVDDLVRGDVREALLDSAIILRLRDNTKFKHLVLTSREEIKEKIQSKGVQGMAPSEVNKKLLFLLKD
ncbi:Testis-expressed protein 10-like, partial [Homarus americanus]